MINLKKYKIGMRTLKTGLAVSISLFIAGMLNLKSPIFVGIGAIMAMQSSVSESFIAGIDRMLGTIVGALVGLIFSYIFPQSVIILGLGIILVIHIHYILGWKKSLSLSAIVFLAVFLNVETARIPYATNRIIDTFIGISVAVLVNYFIFAPNNRQNLMKAIAHLYDSSKSMVFSLIRGKEDFSLEDFEAEISATQESYSQFKKDIDFNFYKTAKTESISKMLYIIDDIYIDINTLTKLDIKPVISNNNKSLLEKLSLNINQDSKEELSELDIVYNYHLNKLLINLIEIGASLEKNMSDIGD